MDAIRKIEGMPTDAEVAEWQRLAELGYEAHRNTVVEPFRGPEWKQAGMTTALQWINGAEAIEADLRAKHAQTLASKEAEIARLRAMADEYENWIRCYHGGGDFGEFLRAALTQPPKE